jgi:CRP/FNR family transcriptional regulator, cyclic AMP receptor protein
MVTKKLLDLYPFFSFLQPGQLRHLREISEEADFNPGAFIFREGEPAEWFFILDSGAVNLLYVVDRPTYPTQTKELWFAGLEPGDIFGISALIPPHIFTSSARASKTSQVIKIHAPGLIELCQGDATLAYHLYSQVAQAAVERLNKTRRQLAASRDLA